MKKRSYTKYIKIKKNESRKKIETDIKISHLTKLAEQTEQTEQTEQIKFLEEKFSRMDWQSVLKKIKEENDYSNGTLNALATISSFHLSNLEDTKFFFYLSIKNGYSKNKLIKLLFSAANRRISRINCLLGNEDNAIRRIIECSRIDKTI